jgi:hypothetical protein
MHTWSKVNFAGLMYKYFHLLGSEPVKHVLLQQRSSGKQYLYAKCASRKAGLRPAHAPMAAYLPEPSTRAILFAPIRAAVIDALGPGVQTPLQSFADIVVVVAADAKRGRRGRRDRRDRRGRRRRCTSGLRRWRDGWHGGCTWSARGQLNRQQSGRRNKFPKSQAACW